MKKSPQVKPDFERAFMVLERCESARCLTDLKAAVVESLGTVFNYRNVSFFSGPTFSSTFDDHGAIVEGATARMLPEYLDRWSHYDVFGAPSAMKMLKATGLAALPELATANDLPAPAITYVRHFLAGKWQMESAAAMHLDLYESHTALIGIFCEDRTDIGPVEIATLRALSKPLSAIARGIPYVSSREHFTGLSERQRELVRLVAEGMSNAQIAETMSLAEDSVKKYVSRILAATGCQTRMALILLARSDVRLGAHRPT
jgi:DNA-binding CsgD family transcriptional regulator